MEPARHFASRAAFAFMLFVMILPVIAIPLASIPYEMQKGMLVALASGLFLVVAAVAFALSKRPLPLRTAPEMFAGIPLVIIGIISTIGHPIGTAVLGAGFEVGTVAAAGLFAFVILAAALISRDQHAFHVVTTFILASVALGGIASVSVIPTSVLGGTLVGAWQQAGFLAMLAFVASVVYAATAPMPLRALYIATAFSSLIVFSILFVPAAAIVGAVVLVTAGAAMHFKVVLVEKSTSDQFVFLIFGVAAAGLLAASLIATIIKIDRPVEPVPSLMYTELVIASQYIDTLRGALVGTGEPYAYAFNKYRTSEANESPFWNRAPESAGSMVLDLASSRGLLGLLAFFVIPASLIAALWRLRRVTVLDATSVAAISIALGSIVLMLFAEVGIALLLISAASIGLVFRAAGRERGVEWGRSMKAIAVAIVILAIGIGTLAVVVRQVIAAEFYSRVVAEDILQGDAAVRFLELASRSWSTPEYEIAAARAIFITDFSSTQGAGASQEELADSLDRLMRHADQAGDTGRNHVSAVLFRASVYTTLVSLGYQAARETAENGLRRAESLAKNLPELHYLRAVLAYNSGDIDGAMSEVEKALALKPDYAEAVEFARRLKTASVAAEQ